MLPNKIDDGIPIGVAVIAFVVLMWLLPFWTALLVSLLLGAVTFWIGNGTMDQR